jgi:predicted dienelactone hydrolase
MLQSVAHAAPVGGTRQSEGLQAPAFGQLPGTIDPTLPVVDNSLNETVIRVPEDDITLQTTIFKPDGNGPFPMIVFNHGKLPGDSHNQPRNRPLALAREFVRHGYVVVVPNRRGFAESDGNYAGSGCNVEANGYAQARDVAATVAYMSQQPYVDKTRIVVGGTSHGGLTAIAKAGRKTSPRRSAPTAKRCVSRRSGSTAITTPCGRASSRARCIRRSPNTARKPRCSISAATRTTRTASSATATVSRSGGRT